jgi:hypothetical protein
MKCFTHQAKEAVGVCKACSKGICAECAADLGHSIACKSSCEEQAHLLDSAIQRSITVLKSSKRYANLTPAFLAVMGLLFAFYGIYRYPRSEFSLTMGIGFLVFAGIYYFVMRKWNMSEKKPGQST